MVKAVVLWTGGKDSALAYYRSLERGITVVGLATFVPADDREFKAHPQNKIKLQAEQLSLPIYFLPVSEPYKKSYIDNLIVLKTTLGISAVITGDIDFVDGQPNWIVTCCAEAELEVFCPLWQESRQSIMTDLLRKNIRAQISWINHQALSEKWLGRYIDCDSLKELSIICENSGMDLCGENGEYHTMVDFNNVH